VIAAAWLLRRHAPSLRVRVVNVVDLMTLFAPRFHPHGLSDEAFVALFTEAKPVVFAFHGYQRAVHELIHGRPGAERFHVRGFNEEGTTTTPFDMVVRNEMSRYDLCLEAVRRAPRGEARGAALVAHCRAMLDRHHGYIREHFEDMPETRDWRWTEP
jgi:xylulose-5-phosphate/fructose-6-phosphate phosphoketolase